MKTKYTKSNSEFINCFNIFAVAANCLSQRIKKFTARLINVKLDEQVKLNFGAYKTSNWFNVAFSPSCHEAAGKRPRFFTSSK